MSSTTPRIFGLDLLRSVAILAVVLAHGLVFLYPHHPRAGVLGYFGIGVDLFFVLSGYLIGGILLRSGEALGTGRGLLHFWLRRWLRTLPNYYLFGALLLVLGLFVWGTSPAYWRGVWQSATFTQNLAWKPDSGFFPESWTLAIEEWFYLLAPLAIAGAMRCGLGFRAAFAGVLGFLLIAPLVARCLAPASHDWATGLRQFVIYRLDSIAWGLLAAWIAAGAPQVWQRVRVPAALAGVALSVVSYWMLLRMAAHDTWYLRTFLFTQFAVGFALLLPWAAQWRTDASNLPARFIRATARWSYSMYLCNLGLMLLGHHFLMEHVKGSVAMAWLVFAGFFVACYAVSALAYRLWERRFLDYRDRWALTRER